MRVTAAAALLAVSLPVALILPLAKWNPPTTALQLERRAAALSEWRRYWKRQQWRELDAISPRLRRAVLTAEDQRFFAHQGLDLDQAERAWRELTAGHRQRGASTVTMQLVKNLYLWEGWTIYDRALRKGFEVYLTLWMEALLDKDRILELYLNVIEWGDGIYGAEAAARAFYGVGADDLSETQAARLAAVLPAPLRHRPNDGSSFVDHRARRIMGRSETPQPLSPSAP